MIIRFYEPIFGLCNKGLLTTKPGHFGTISNLALLSVMSKWVKLTSVFRKFINKSFFKSFDIIFMKNIKSCQKIQLPFSPIKSF